LKHRDDFTIKRGNFNITLYRKEGRGVEIVQEEEEWRELEENRTKEGLSK
jgi:SH3-like domain-containing protein